MKQLLILLLATSLITSCNNNSGVGGGGGGGSKTKGWSKSDRNNFLRQCEQGLAGVGYTESNAREACDCVLGKVQKKYASMKEADEKGGEAAGSQAMLECAGMKGNNNMFNNDDDSDDDDNRYGKDDDEDDEDEDEDDN